MHRPDESSSFFDEQSVIEGDIALIIFIWVAITALLETLLPHMRNACRLHCALQKRHLELGNTAFQSCRMKYGDFSSLWKFYVKNEIIFLCNGRNMKHDTPFLTIKLTQKQC